MTSAAQRAELQAKIWKIANDVRGPVDGLDFKHFMLSQSDDYIYSNKKKGMRLFTPLS